jgi:hypothetical protein
MAWECKGIFRFSYLRDAIHPQYSADTLYSKLDRQAVCCHQLFVFDRFGGKEHTLYIGMTGPYQQQILTVHRIQCIFN